MEQLSKYAFCIVLIALVWLPAKASAQRMLDDYTSGAYVKHCAYERVLPTYANPISIDFPFSGFNKPGGLTQADASDIDYIVIEAYGGGFASFGIASLQALN
jgi:hypothetical protein